MNCFLVSSKKQIFVYEYETFKKINEVDLSVMKYSSKQVILNLKLSHSQRYLAVLVGHKTLNRTNILTHLIIL